ncbi:MAG: hypothetical protein K5860_00210 [Bacteroidales bacterium]|nr:hypothetical protein [Bacteroidales bacterium]
MKIISFFNSLIVFFVVFLFNGCVSVQREFVCVSRDDSTNVGVPYFEKGTLKIKIHRPYSKIVVKKTPISIDRKMDFDTKYNYPQDYMKKTSPKPMYLPYCGIEPINVYYTNLESKIRNEVQQEILLKIMTVRNSDNFKKGWKTYGYGYKRSWRFIHSSPNRTYVKNYFPPIGYILSMQVIPIELPFIKRPSERIYYRMAGIDGYIMNRWKFYKIIVNTTHDSQGHKVYLWERFVETAMDSTLNKGLRYENLYHDTIKIPAGIYPIEKTSFLIAVDTKISTNNILFLDKNFYSYDISKERLYRDFVKEYVHLATQMSCTHITKLSRLGVYKAPNNKSYIKFLKEDSVMNMEDYKKEWERFHCDDIDHYYLLYDYSTLGVPIIEQNCFYPFRESPDYLTFFMEIMSYNEYEPQFMEFEKKHFYQFYYTFKSLRDGKNYRLHYNARNGKFVNYKEIKND